MSYYICYFHERIYFGACCDVETVIYDNETWSNQTIQTFPQRKLFTDEGSKTIKNMYKFGYHVFLWNERNAYDD